MLAAQALLSRPVAFLLFVLPGCGLEAGRS